MEDVVAALTAPHRGHEPDDLAAHHALILLLRQLLNKAPCLCLFALGQFVPLCLSRAKPVFPVRGSPLPPVLQGGPSPLASAPPPARLLFCPRTHSVMGRVRVRASVSSTGSPLWLPLYSGLLFDGTLPSFRFRKFLAWIGPSVPALFSPQVFLMPVSCFRLATFLSGLRFPASSFSCLVLLILLLVVGVSCFLVPVPNLSSPGLLGEPAGLLRTGDLVVLLGSPHVAPLRVPPPAGTLHITLLHGWSFRPLAPTTNITMVPP